MRWSVVACAILLVLAAGCSDKEPPGKSGQDSSSSSSTSASTSNTTAPNQAPTGTISVAINGTSAAFNLTGIDPDGDALVWNLTFGDGTSTNGTALPAMANHTYEPGNYTAALHLSDGNLTAQLNATVVVTATTSEAIAGVGQSATGSWIMGSMVVGCFGDIFMPTYPAELNGIAFASFAIEPLSIGLPVHIDITSSGVADSPGFTFLDADGAVLVSAFLGDVPDKVPAGAATGVFWVCAGGPMEGTYVSG